MNSSSSIPPCLQSYNVNLQATAVIALLAHLPHPNLHEFLLQPLITLQPGARTLTTVIQKVPVYTLTAEQNACHAVDRWVNARKL